MLRSIQTAATPGALQARQAAIVHVAMFDAFNGVERQYTQIHVTDLSPRRGASRRAAVVQAAYASLVARLSVADQRADWPIAKRRSPPSPTDEAIENSESIERGLEWGQRVAEEIVAWRNADGLSTVLPTVCGQPRARQMAPDAAPADDAGGPEQAGLSRRVPTLATTTPFVIPSPSSFRSPTGRRRSRARSMRRNSTK